jgi:hypothetical protein
MFLCLAEKGRFSAPAKFENAPRAVSVKAARSAPASWVCLD